MKLTTFNSVLIIASITFSSGIATAQPVIDNYTDAEITAGVTTDEQINTAISSNTLHSNSTNVSYFNPSNLVSFAYQGHLEQQGIPTGNALLSEYQNRNISAKDLVQAAINTNNLPPQALQDEDYLSSVELQLTEFSVDSPNEP